MTPPEAQVLEAVRAYIAKHGYSPSTRDLMAATGVPSSSTIHRRLAALQRLGLITQEPHKVRTVRLTQPA